MIYVCEPGEVIATKDKIINLGNEIRKKPWQISSQNCSYFYWIFVFEVRYQPLVLSRILKKKKRVNLVWFSFHHYSTASSGILFKWVFDVLYQKKTLVKCMLDFCARYCGIRKYRCLMILVILVYVSLNTEIIAIDTNRYV